MNKQRGFTLLELVIAMAIFALLGLACWRFFDGVLRTERTNVIKEQNVRALHRAFAVIERDILQVTVQPLSLKHDRLQLQRANWRNPLDVPRSELQNVTYHLEKGVLWRESLDPRLALVHRQKLLSDVRELHWRVYNDDHGWRSDWPASQKNAKAQPQALELVLSTANIGQIRRVLLLPGSSS